MFLIQISVSCHGEVVMGHARVHSKVFALVPQAGTPSLHGTVKLRTEGWVLATKAKNRKGKIT